jgi:hypothetical protein
MGNGTFGDMKHNKDIQTVDNILLRLPVNRSIDQLKVLIPRAVDLNQTNGTGDHISSRSRHGSPRLDLPYAVRMVSFLNLRGISLYPHEVFPVTSTTVEKAPLFPCQVRRFYTCMEFTLNGRTMEFIFNGRNMEFTFNERNMDLDVQQARCRK